MKVLTNQKGDVMFAWVKKRVDKKDADFYKYSPNYKELYKSESGRIFGFRRILDSDDPMPEHLELCTEEEITRLEKNDISLRGLNDQSES